MGLLSGKNARDIFSSVKKTVVDTTKQVSSNIKEYNDKAKEAKAPIEGTIKRYGVIYLGGLQQHTKKQSGEIGFNILPESFYLKPTTTSQDWFEDMVIPYSKVQKFEIVTRQLSNTELLLTDDARGLEQDNNIHITYLDDEGNETVLRLEMLTGITVAGQAGKCREMMDLLRQNKILKLLNKEEKATISSTSAESIPDQLIKLNELKNAGILSEDEFNAKKTELLAKMWLSE